MLINIRLIYISTYHATTKFLARRSWLWHCVQSFLIIDGRCPLLVFLYLCYSLSIDNKLQSSPARVCMSLCVCVSPSHSLSLRMCIYIYTHICCADCTSVRDCMYTRPCDYIARFNRPKRKGWKIKAAVAMLKRNASAHVDSILLLSTWIITARPLSVKVLDCIIESPINII